MSTAATWKTYFIITGLPYVLANLTYNVELNIATIEKTSGNFFATHRSPLLRFLCATPQPFKCLREDPVGPSSFETRSNSARSTEEVEVGSPTEISNFALTNDVF